MSCDLVLVRAKMGPSPNASSWVTWPPLGILNIAIYLRQRGFEVGIFDRYDPVLGALSPEEAADSILATYPGVPVVGISAMTSECEDAIALGDALMRRPGVRVVHGGTHFGSMPEAGLAHGHAVVCGEGEICLEERLRQGPESLEGIIPARKLTEAEMDAIPFPGKPELAETGFNPDAAVEFPVITARGCPFDCNFCKDGFRFQSAVRAISVDNVVDYLGAIHRDLGFRRFFILDDIFTLSMKRLEEMTAALTGAGLDLRFRCFLHANTVIPQRLELAKAMGVDRVSIGVESGSDEVLKTVGKGTTIARLQEAIDLCREFDFHVTGLYMLGNTGENVSTMVETIAFARSLPTDSDWFSFAIPYPGTPFAGLVDRYGSIIEPDLQKWTPGNLVYLPDGVTEAEMHHLLGIARNLCPSDARPETKAQGQTPKDHTERVPEEWCTWRGPAFRASDAGAELRSLALDLRGLGHPLRVVPEGSDPSWNEALPGSARASLLHLADEVPGRVGVDISSGPASGWTPDASARIRVGRPSLDRAAGVSREDVARCNAMDEIWVASDFHRKVLIAAGVTVPMSVLQNGVDADRFGPDAPRHALQDESVRTFLAIVEDPVADGLDMILSAWKMAFPREAPVRLLLAPTASAIRLPSEEELNDLAPVTVLPPVSETARPGLLASADVFLQSASNHTWAPRVAEAMAIGLPVITSREGGHREYVTEENAYLVDPEGGPDELARALQNTYEDTGSAAARGEKARRTMVEKWTWKRAALQILDRLETLSRSQSSSTASPVHPHVVRPSELDTLLARADRHREQREYSDAVRCIRQALQLEPDDVRVYSGLGILGLEVGNRDAVRTALQKIGEIQPNHPLLDLLGAQAERA